MSRFLTHIRNKQTWLHIGLLAFLLSLDLLVHPLGNGPDRLIHDPPVYRLHNARYLPGDWYTAMAAESGVYTFYAELINLGTQIGIAEELWRRNLYFLTLCVLYYSIVAIARIFSTNLVVVPMIAGIHAVLLSGGRSPWLYGPFMQIDGGLAPRSIGVSLSFLALLYLLRRAPLYSMIVLGIATLFHVSNSLIIFTLFLSAWIIFELSKPVAYSFQRFVLLIRNTVILVAIYLATGGWFAVYISQLTTSVATTFSPQKFIWAWTYFRAPYLALPLINARWWILFGAHLVCILLGWIILRRHYSSKALYSLQILFIIALVATIYFSLFYLFGFILPWIPGFQFYSIRVVYLVYFVAYLFFALLLLRRKAIAYIFLGITWILFLLYPTHVRVQMADHTSQIRTYVQSHPQPFLAPPTWNESSEYLPNIVSFKSIGFTKDGLPEWFERMNDVTDGELQHIYEMQESSKGWAEVLLDFTSAYSRLTASRVVELSIKYGFRLFLSYKDVSYPFPLIAEDSEYRLYEIPNNL